MRTLFTEPSDSPIVNRRESTGLRVYSIKKNYLNARQGPRMIFALAWDFEPMDLRLDLVVEEPIDQKDPAVYQPSSVGQ